MVYGLAERQFAKLLTTDGIAVQFGPFAVRIRTDLARLAPLVYSLYAPYPLASPGAFIDFHVAMERVCGLRRWMRPQVRFCVDGQSPFAPYAAEHALPALEWGINWCMATRVHHLLMLHAAVVERNGQAILFPAWPGHGKSTLCTALVYSGWRLLSDEFGLLRPEDSLLLPIPRLIPLKNESIEVIKRFRPEARIGPPFFKTRKGTVAHVQPPEESIRRAEEPARARWLIFPRWVPSGSVSLAPLSKGQAFIMTATNAFNYEVLGEVAFRTVANMVRSSGCYTLSYSELDQALDAIERLVASPG